MTEAVIWYSPQLFTYTCYATSLYLLAYAATKVMKGVRYAVIRDIEGHSSPS